MFDIGFWELSLIAVIALVVLGPERLPRVARQAGLWVRKMKRMVADVKTSIDHELEMEDLKAIKQAGQDLKHNLAEGLRSTQQEIDKVGSEFEGSSDEKSSDPVDMAAAMKQSSPAADAAPGGAEQQDKAGGRKKTVKKTAAKASKKKAGKEPVAGGGKKTKKVARRAGSGKKKADEKTSRRANGEDSRQQG